LKNDVNAPSKSNKQNLFKKIVFVGVLRSMPKIAGSGSGSTPKCHGYSATLTVSKTIFFFRLLTNDLIPPYLSGMKNTISS
jgi:hypothetical protein